MAKFTDITETTGRTPLVRLNRLSKGLDCEIYLKLEFFNPLSSVKDRIGVSMINAAEKSGELKPGMTLIEPTSGNTGISLSFIGAARGYPVTLVMPETMSMERRTLLLLLGAKLILTPGPLGMKGAIAKSLELLEKTPGSFSPSQFANRNNVKVHFEKTAQEIWEDTDGQVDVVVSGVGTGGTISGVGEYLKQKKSKVQMVAVEPTESPILSGGKAGPHKIQGIGAGFVPEILDRNVIDQIEQISSAEALVCAKDVIQKEGIPVGISSGAAIGVALRLAQSGKFKGKTIVVVVASSSERYLTTALAEQESQQAKALDVSEVSEEWLNKASQFLKM